MRLRMEHFYTGSMAVTVKYALTREQMEAAAKKQAKTKQHTSGIQHTAWGMEARFRDCQDTLSLLDVLRNVWKQRPRGELYERPFFVGVTLRELIPESEHQATLFGDPDNRGQLSATMDKLNLKYGHTTLHFAGMLPARRDGADADRVYADPGAVRGRVHVGRNFCGTWTITGMASFASDGR